MAGKYFRAVIFDMDGVLVNTEPHHVIIEKRLFEKLGLRISEEEHRSYLGKSPSLMWKEIISNYTLPFTVEELTKKNSEETIRHFSALEEVEIMPGITRLLDDLYIRKIPMALASSSDQIIIEMLLERTGLKKYFHYLVSCENVGKSKPEPDIYLHTARLLGVNPEECLVIEDSPNGILAAKQAGMFCIAYKGRSSGNTGQIIADESIEDFSQLTGIL